MSMIDENTIVFGIGPAGTGKTHLAMARRSRRCRPSSQPDHLDSPAVEAGSGWASCRGTLTDKIDPYLRPLVMTPSTTWSTRLDPRLMAAGTIEAAPLAPHAWEARGTVFRSSCWTRRRTPRPSR